LCGRPAPPGNETARKYACDGSIFLFVKIICKNSCIINCKGENKGIKGAIIIVVVVVVVVVIVVVV